MKHPLLISLAENKLAEINKAIAKLKPIDALNRKKHLRLNAEKKEIEHGLNIIKLLDDL